MNILPGYDVYALGPKMLGRFAKSADEARAILGSDNIGVFKNNRFMFLKTGNSVRGNFCLAALMQIDECVGVFFSPRHKQFMIGVGPHLFIYVDDPHRAVKLMEQWGECRNHRFSIDQGTDLVEIISDISGKWCVNDQYLYVEEDADALLIRLKA